MSASPSTSYTQSQPPRAWWQRVWSRRLLGIGGFGIFCLAIWWGFRDDEISPVAPEPEPPLVAERTQQTVRLNGKRLWHFNAAKIELSPDGSQTFARDVSDGILFRDDKPLLHLSASQVHLENNSNNVDASGGVKVTGENRFAVSSRLVRWDYGQKLLSCPTPVNAHLRSFSFDAPYLQYKWDSGDLTCDFPTKFQAPGVTMEAKRMKASTKTRLIELEGDVHLTFHPKSIHKEDWKGLLPN